MVLAVVAMSVGLNPRAEAYTEDVCCDGTRVFDDASRECPGGRYQNPSAGVDYCTWDSDSSEVATKYEACTQQFGCPGAAICDDPPLGGSLVINCGKGSCPNCPDILANMAIKAGALMANFQGQSKATRLF